MATKINSDLSRARNQENLSYLLYQQYLCHGYIVQHTCNVLPHPNTSELGSEIGCPGIKFHWNYYFIWFVFLLHQMSAEVWSPNRTERPNNSYRVNNITTNAAKIPNSIDHLVDTVPNFRYFWLNNSLKKLLKHF